MTLTRIHHVAVVVRDADQALTFYRDALGLSVSKDEVINEQGVRGVLLPLDNCEIELIQPVDDDTGVAKYLEANGEGLHHICFESDDIAADLKAAKALGMEMIDEVPRAGLAGRIGFIHPNSNHGVLIEFAQPVDGTAAERSVIASASPACPTRLVHVVSVVADVDAAADTFVRHFGMVDAGRVEVEALGISSALLNLGDTQIELSSPTTEDERNPVNRRLRRGEGLLMLALAVSDVKAAARHLQDCGITCTDPADNPSAGSFLSPRHTNGARILLSEA